MFQLKKTYKQGDELIKIVPNGKSPGRSPFYMKRSEFDRLKNSTSLEQELGLPIGSHSVKYDVYKATAKQQVDVFEGTVAPVQPSVHATLRYTGPLACLLHLLLTKRNNTYLKTLVYFYL